MTSSYFQTQTKLLFFVLLFMTLCIWSNGLQPCVHFNSNTSCISCIWIFLNMKARPIYFIGSIMCDRGVRVWLFIRFYWLTLVHKMLNLFTKKEEWKKMHHFSYLVLNLSHFVFSDFFLDVLLSSTCFYKRKFFHLLYHSHYTHFPILFSTH